MRVKPSSQQSQGAPGSPFGPCGMVKLSTAALGVPLSATEAGVPEGAVVVGPTVMEAAAPGAPFGPLSPAEQQHSIISRSDWVLGASGRTRLLMRTSVTGAPRE